MTTREVGIMTRGWNPERVALGEKSQRGGFDSRTLSTISEHGGRIVEWNAEDYPLPEWAEARSDGNYMELGAQLATRDGRKTGNAYVDRVEHHDSLGQLAVVVTDMGNTFRMTIRELEEAFYPPSYVMRLDEARTRRGVTLPAPEAPK